MDGAGRARRWRPRCATRPLLCSHAAMRTVCEKVAALRARLASPRRCSGRACCAGGEPGRPGSCRPPRPRPRVAQVIIRGDLPRLKSRVFRWRTFARAAGLTSRSGPVRRSSCGTRARPAGPRKPLAAPGPPARPGSGADCYGSGNIPLVAVVDRQGERHGKDPGPRALELLTGCCPGRSRGHRRGTRHRDGWPLEAEFGLGSADASPCGNEVGPMFQRRRG